MSETNPSSVAGNDAELYDGSRKRILSLIAGADPSVLSASVAACPGWTVRDLLAHLAGGLGDFLARRLQVADGDDFGERTVRERTDKTVDELLTEWAGHRSQASELLASPIGAVLVTEIISHEQDLRTALGRPGARDDPGVGRALDRPLREIDKRIRADARPAVRLVIDGTPETLGEGEPTATLRASAYEILRAVTGRRSHSQIRALDWDGQARLDAFELFGRPREEDLEETCSS